MVTLRDRVEGSATRTAPARSADALVAFDARRVRGEFPIFRDGRHDPPLVYLDNAASTQKPEAVLAAMDRFHRGYYSNVHRGIHPIAARADAAYEAARHKVALWLGAEGDEIVFTSGTTASINLVAESYLRPRLAAGDRVVVTTLEHHSNLVPWQLACEATGAELVEAPVDDRGQLDLPALAPLLDERVKMLAVTHVSNALGTVVPVHTVIEMAHRAGVPVLVDGAQAVAHLPVDVAALGCDFYAVSAHKAFGPTGVGALYGRRELLAEMVPWQGGGGMIRSVSFERTTYAPPPARFEAGTPNVAGVIGFGAAVDWLAELDLAALAIHEQALLTEAEARLAEVPGLTIVGT
ncbi:MAG TPA: aminotransferase class V-fold PLP-dependent enzyme, partial [Thermoanaerobaculia bacterium]|nr:aminotransferase class V-fold PLP-dependent enzyme [Thermoanaerobaculia bacterium]